MANTFKAIIFGSHGQDGYYLKKLFDRELVECLCISRKGEAVHGDVSDYQFVERHIKEFQPTHIFHFAAWSTARHDALFENHQTISTGTLNILEAVKRFAPNANVFISGSALQFKNQGTPINEQSPFDASSPYAVARIQSVYAARYYRAAFGLNVYVGYFFNHDSPLRTEHHVNQKIVLAVNRIKSGNQEKLELGNIDVAKEFSYAGDIVEAVWLLVNQQEVFEAVIGSGKAYTIKQWVEYCFAKCGLQWSDHVTIKSDYVPEYNVLVSDPSLIMNLGWKPNVTFEQLADMMMEERIIV